MYNCHNHWSPPTVVFSQSCDAPVSEYGGGGGSTDPSIIGAFGAVRICYVTDATGARSFPSTNVGEI